MDFGLFTTWNAVYVGDKVPWDRESRGGKLLEEAACRPELERGARGGGDGVGLLLAGRRPLLHPGEHGPRSPSCCRRPLPAAPNK